MCLYVWFYILMAKYTISLLNFNTLNYFTCQLSFFSISYLNLYFWPISHLVNKHQARFRNAGWPRLILWHTHTWPIIVFFLFQHLRPIICDFSWVFYQTSGEQNLELHYFSFFLWLVTFLTAWLLWPTIIKIEYNKKI